VQAWGTLGFSVSGHDPMDGASNRNGAKAMRLFIGDSLVFDAGYDWFDYGASGQSVLEWDYRILRMYGKNFRDLYIRRETNCRFIPGCGQKRDGARLRSGIRLFADPFSSGAIRIGRGNWTFLAEVSDYSGNCSRIRGVLRAWPQGEPDDRSVRPVLKRNGIYKSLAGDENPVFR